MFITKSFSLRCQDAGRMLFGAPFTPNLVLRTASYKSRASTTCEWLRSEDPHDSAEIVLAAPLDIPQPIWRDPPSV